MERAHKQLAKQEQEHLQQVFQERERHEQAYAKEALAEGLERNNERLRSTVVEQRDEIKYLLNRISRYAPQEFVGKVPNYVPG